MAYSRDIAYQALFDRLSAKVPEVLTWTRQSLLAMKIPASATPAGVLLVASQIPDMQHGLPTTWTLGADLHLLVSSIGQKASLDSVLNDLVDRVEAALLRDAEETYDGDRVHTTLEGVVEWVKISGPVEFFQSEGGDLSEVIIPIDMLSLGDES